MRAIEVCLLTGKPFSAFREEWETAPGPVTGFFLTRDRDDLHSAHQRACWEMFRNGAVEEVRGMTNVSATAAQAIGFKEIRAYLDGKMSECECITRIQQATRQYAKRQITWFKRETMLETVNLSVCPDSETVIRLIVQKVRVAFP